MICFVILHYLVTKETASTVDSILNNVEGEFKIIIVDNCSPNDSFEKLNEKYSNSDRVDVIMNTSNAGYAKGINYGYDFAKMNYSPDYIVGMNNDMEIKQKEFIDLVVKSYKETGFYVMGPDIYSTSAERHQNPEKDHIRNLKEIEEHIQEVEATKNNVIKLKLKQLLRNISFVKKHYYNRKKKINKKEYIDVRRTNVTLHGSCLIFSKKFIDEREYCMFPETEFYCESQILDYECLRDKMLTIYEPSIKIYHHEDVSTDAVAGNYVEKMQKKCKRVLESLNIFKEIMVRDQKGKS